MKALVAKALAEKVSDGDVIGLGSGSTVELAVEQIGRRVREDGLKVIGVPTSHRIARVADQAGITVVSPYCDYEPTWGFDGADEVDPAFNLIKGRGGAMLPEKIMALRCKEWVVIVSEDKLVKRLGTKHPVPIEVIPEALQVVEKGLKALGARETVLRAATNKYGPEMTEHNNLILDAWFDQITIELDLRIKGIVGVVEHGLFVGMTKEILVSNDSRVWRLKMSGGKVHEEAVVA